MLSFVCARQFSHYVKCLPPDTLRKKMRLPEISPGARRFTENVTQEFLIRGAFLGVLVKGNKFKKKTGLGYSWKLWYLSKSQRLTRMFSEQVTLNPWEMVKCAQLEESPRWQQ